MEKNGRLLWRDPAKNPNFVGNEILFMRKYFLLFAIAGLLSGCRERTELQKSYAFDQKAGWYYMIEGMKQNVDKEYVPDYTKVFIYSDSAIAHSPDNPLFYGLKASRCFGAGEYRVALDTYLRLFSRGITPSEDLSSVGMLYDSLGIRDSAAYYYRRALDGYRRDLPGLAADTMSYNTTVYRIQVLEERLDTMR